MEKYLTFFTSIAENPNVKEVNQTLLQNVSQSRNPWLGEDSRPLEEKLGTMLKNDVLEEEFINEIVLQYEKNLKPFIVQLTEFLSKNRKLDLIACAFLSNIVKQISGENYYRLAKALTVNLFDGYDLSRSLVKSFRLYTLMCTWTEINNNSLLAYQEKYKSFFEK